MAEPKAHGLQLSSVTQYPEWKYFAMRMLLLVDVRKIITNLPVQSRDSTCQDTVKQGLTSSIKDLACERVLTLLLSQAVQWLQSREVRQYDRSHCEEASQTSQDKDRLFDLQVTMPMARSWSVPHEATEV